MRTTLTMTLGECYADVLTRPGENISEADETPLSWVNVTLMSLQTLARSSTKQRGRWDTAVNDLRFESHADYYKQTLAKRSMRQMRHCQWPRERVSLMSLHTLAKSSERQMGQRCQWPWVEVKPHDDGISSHFGSGSHDAPLRGNPSKIVLQYYFAS